MNNIINTKLRKKLPIILVLTLTTITYIWRLWEEGLANLYYSAGVYSMGQNFHAFFFNSIDSVGFISIDKPPLGLWIQVLFTKVFGFNGFAILLPQALAAIFSVYFIYKIIDKRFSRTAGVASALVFAFTPILVAVCRNNTIDGILIFLLVSASWLAILAAEQSSLKQLVLASVVIALGFNVKSLQAYMIVPAVYLTYLVFSNEIFQKKLINCLISVVVLIVISFSWVMIVDLTPAQNRPYIGSSGTNSELNLTLGNNGISRLLGGDYSKSSSGINLYTIGNNQIIQQIPTQLNKDLTVSNNNNPSDINIIKKPMKEVTLDNNIPPEQKGSQDPTQSFSNGEGNGGESGSTSLYRLYIVNNAGQIAWFLFPAVLSSLIFIFLFIKKRLKAEQKYISLYYFTMCFLPMLIYFSLSNGVVHRYYLAMLAFPVASLIGIGLSFIEKNNKINHIIMLIIFILIAITHLYIQSLYKGWLDWLLPLYTFLIFIVFIILVAGTRYNIKKEISIYSLAVLLILPCIWSLTPMIYGNNAQLPISGPELVKQGDAFDMHPDLSKLITYLNSNRGDATYFAAAPSSMSLGAELILQSREPVMMLGGFNGGDDPLTVDEFRKFISDGKIKYAILSNDGAGNSPKQSPVLNWIAENCLKVTEDLNGITLYQLNVQK